MSQSDAELIQACRQGQRHAWQNLIDKYERLVFSIPLSYGLNRADAADIAQLVFTILLQSLDNLQPDSHLGGWLATVTRRHTWRWIERHRREFATEDLEITNKQPLWSNEAEERTIEQWEQAEWLHQGLNHLDDHCRQLLLTLYFAEDQPSYAEVARQIDIPVGSIGPTRARCLEKLKRLLEEKGAD
jgi:RNA polymerase sigma factor (sigma-70 family)